MAAQYATAVSIERTHHADAHAHEPEALDLLLHAVHNWVGMVVGALMLVCLVLRWRIGPPLVGVTRTTWRALLAAGTHAAFYAVLIAQTGTGAVASYLFWPALKVHVVLADVTLGLIALHVAGALLHLAVARDRFPLRMVSLRSRGKAA